MKYTEFTDLCNQANEMALEDARLEDKESRLSGFSPVTSIYGADGMARLFWREIQYTILDGDRVGVVICGEGETAIRGLALWRPSSEDDRI